jgi:hypothetical protein
MAAIHDAVVALTDQQSNVDARNLIDELTARGKLSLESVTFLRGRSLQRQMVIIDEAQNLEPTTLRTILTRVGEGTKVVFTGDTSQIDAPYLGETNNALAVLTTPSAASRASATSRSRVRAQRRRQPGRRAPVGPDAVSPTPIASPMAVGGGQDRSVDFELPADLKDFLVKIDDFIEREIKPLEQENDNIRFLDHRGRTPAPTGTAAACPNKEWEDLMREARKRADSRGIYRYSYPKRLGGMDGTNLGMAVIREHLAPKGLGLHCDLQTEHTIVGNILGVMLMEQYGSDEQKAYWLPRMTEHGGGFSFGITELNHGSTPRGWRPTPTRTATSGSSTATRRGTRACTTRPTT